MLSERALEFKSKKKKFYIAIAKLFGLYRNMDWHITKKEERIELCSLFRIEEKKIHLVPNLPYIFSIEKKMMTKETGKLKLVFLSRVVPIKNLHTLILALSKCNSNNHIELSIYGPLEDVDYVSRCKKLFLSLGANCIVSFKGVLDKNEIGTVLSDSDFLIHPSLSENYGHSIVESLCCATPVIIGSNTPWTNVESLGAGFVVKDVENELEWLQVLNKAFDLNNEAYSRMSYHAIAYSKKYCLSPEIEEASRRMFR
jgi:glycosyltransferase involved in cell wall biosynthesis